MPHTRAATISSPPLRAGRSTAWAHRHCTIRRSTLCSLHGIQRSPQERRPPWRRRRRKSRFRNRPRRRRASCGVPLQKIQDFALPWKTIQRSVTRIENQSSACHADQSNYCGIQETKERGRQNPGHALNLGDGSGHGGIAASVPRVALPTGRAPARGFDSLPFCLRGPAETQQVFGLAG